VSDQVSFRSGNQTHIMILFPRQANLPRVFSIYRDNTKINPYYYSKNRGQNSTIRSKCLIVHANRHYTMNGSGLCLTLLSILDSGCWIDRSCIVQSARTWSSLSPPTPLRRCSGSFETQNAQRSNLFSAPLGQAPVR